MSPVVVAVAAAVGVAVVVAVVVGVAMNIINVAQSGFLLSPGISITVGR